MVKTAPPSWGANPDIPTESAFRCECNHAFNTQRAGQLPSLLRRSVQTVNRSSGHFGPSAPLVPAPVFTQYTHQSFHLTILAVHHARLLLEQCSL